VTSGASLPVVRLILELATGVRQGVSGQEIQSIREHVAAAGFSPTLRMPADPRVVGLMTPSGEGPLTLDDTVDVGELHYLRHVVIQREWPFGTAVGDYYASGADLALDPRSGVLLSTVGRFGVHIGIVGRSGRNQGARGYPWMLVDFRVSTGHWATFMQLRAGLQHFNEATRVEKTWLRLPS
jgi:hypothetical protein